MTTQEAINYLLDPLSLPESMDIKDKLRWHEDALNMAIEALKAQDAKPDEKDHQKLSDSDKLGVKTGETCADAVSREVAIDAVQSIERLATMTDNDAVVRMSAVEYVLYRLPSVQPEPQWIPCNERMPECEQEVLICTIKRVYVSKKTGMEWCKEPVITPAIYEDGSMLEVNSKWHWEDIDYAGWDEEEDCGIIPEGWWENRHFNPDEVYNNPVDKEVIAWMPLPKAPKIQEREDNV